MATNIAYASHFLCVQIMKFLWYIFLTICVYLNLGSYTFSTLKLEANIYSEWKETLIMFLNYLVVVEWKLLIVSIFFNSGFLSYFNISCFHMHLNEAMCCAVLSHTGVSSFCDPITCQAPLSMGILQARTQEWVAMPSSRGPSQPRDPTLQADSLPSEPPGKPKNTGMGSLSLLQGSFQPRNQTKVSCIAGRFFTSWAMREPKWSYTCNLSKLIGLGAISVI